MTNRVKVKSSKTKEEAAAISRANGAKAKKINAKGSCYETSAPMVVETALADMYADIYDPRAKVDPNLKIHAAMCYMMTGTVTGAAKLTGLDHRLISEWKNKAQWWVPVLAKVKQEKQDELDAAFSEVIHNATNELKDRIQHGEEVVTKDGIVVRRLGGRDLATILNTVYDKRSMVRGDPTSISRKETSDDVMDKLRKEFETIAENTINKKVVSDQ